MILPVNRLRFFSVIFLVQLGFCKVEAQSRFQGSFIMSFEAVESRAGNANHPMLWNIETDREESRMAMEIQDSMQRKGVSKRVLFNPLDSTWTMLIEFK